MERVENVGKRTPSDPMKTGCRGKSRHFAGDLINIRQSRVEEGVENVGKRMECYGDWLPWQDSIGLQFVSSRET